MRYLKMVLRVATAILILMWIKNPQSSIEPTLAAISFLFSLIPDHQKQPNPSLLSPQAPEPPAVTPGEEEPVNVEKEVSGFPYASPTALFEIRFALAFPGQRTSKWFYAADAVDRLAILLKSPLVFHKTESRVEPIWWFRFGNSSITQFQKLSNKEVLLDHQEINVEKIYASYSSDYKRLFVYVKCLPSPSTGLYQSTRAEEAPYFSDFGYLWEEYALFKGHKVTRAEHDDNAAVIMGKPISLEGKSELRTRYTTPYNFVICAQDCPINNMHFDRVLDRFMRAALDDDSVLPLLERAVEELPYRHNG
jgi:hypothetical protein